MFCISPKLATFGYFSFKTREGNCEISENQSNSKPNLFQATLAASIPEQMLPTDQREFVIFAVRTFLCPVGAWYEFCICSKLKHQQEQKLRGIAFRDLKGTIFILTDPILYQYQRLFKDKG